MNDTMSLLLATGILAIGGLGLFMYKSSSDDDSSDNKDTDTDTDNLFDFNSFFSNSDDDKNDDEELESYKPKTTSKGSKTKSTRKTTGSRRRH